MPDQTNISDFDPATGRTTTTLVSTHDRGSLEHAEAEGQEHDTWHRPSTERTVQDDPAAYTIDYIKEWVDDHPDLADEVLAAEEARGDDARTTLVTWLQGFITHRDED